MMHPPDTSEVADYVAKGSIFTLVCFSAFVLVVVFPLLFVPLLLSVMTWAIVMARRTARSTARR